MGRKIRNVEHALAKRVWLVIAGTIVGFAGVMQLPAGVPRVAGFAAMCGLVLFVATVGYPWPSRGVYTGRPVTTLREAHEAL